LALRPEPTAATTLWVADTQSGRRHAITSGTTGSLGPAVSPDGNRLILGENTGNYDVVSVDLATAAARPLIATERDEGMPAWAARQPALVYVGDRNGPPEIWLHRLDTPHRPIGSGRECPERGTQWLRGPASSPGADRVVYVRIEGGGGTPRLWISAVAGGAPVRLTNDNSAELPGSWSVDGAWFAYRALLNGNVS